MEEGTGESRGLRKGAGDSGKDQGAQKRNRELEDETLKLREGSEAWGKGMEAQGGSRWIGGFWRYGEESMGMKEGGGEWRGGG